MGRFLDYFLAGVDQALVLVAALAVLAGLAAVGAVIFGRDRLVEAEVFGGWALALVAFTAPGVLWGAPFTPAFWALLVLALAALALRWRREGRVIPPGWGRVVAVGLPLLLLASARMASEWDEFSQWVPAGRLLIEDDVLPLGKPDATGLSFPGYPFGWPLLGYMVNRVAGGFIESSGAVLNVLLLFVFGLAAVRVWSMAAGRRDDGGLGWTAAAFAVLAGTLLNPSFAQKVAVTSYADVSSAVAVAFGGILGWLIVEALAEGDRPRASRLAWQFGLVMLVLVDIKQANLVLFVLLVGGVGAAGLRDPAIRATELLRLAPVMVVPAVLIYGLWRYHVAVNLPPAAEAQLKPFAEWNLHILGPILARMALVATKKGVYFSLMALAVVFAVRGLVRCRGPFDRLAIVVGAAFVGYNAFLFFIFVAQFGEYDARRVASYWRYNMHLGLLAVVFAAYGTGVLWRRFMAARAVPRVLVWLPVMVAVAAPVAFAKKVRFDLEHPKPFYRQVGAELPVLLPAGARMFIFDPLGTGESAVLTRYGLWHRRDAFVGYSAAYHNNQAPKLRRVLADIGPSHLLVHSVTPAVAEVLGLPLTAGMSYLVEKAGGAGARPAWRIVKKWPRSDDHWARR